MTKYKTFGWQTLNKIVWQSVTTSQAEGSRRVSFDLSGSLPRLHLGIFRPLKLTKHKRHLHFINNICHYFTIGSKDTVPVLIVSLNQCLFMSVGTCSSGQHSWAFYQNDRLIMSSHDRLLAYCFWLSGLRNQDMPCCIYRVYFMHTICLKPADEGFTGSNSFICEFTNSQLISVRCFRKISQADFLL